MLKKKMEAQRKQEALKNRLIAVFRAGLESPDPKTRELYGRILEDFLNALSGFVKIDPSGKWVFSPGSDQVLERYVKDHPTKITGEESELLRGSVDQALDPTVLVENSEGSNEKGKIQTGA